MRVAGDRSGKVILAALLLSAVFLLYHEFLDYSQLGHDSYPIIIASRIESVADFAGTFTEELMDGRYPSGHFYRPVLNLSIAIDYALWDLRPFGYHLTDLLLLAGCAIGMAMLFRSAASVSGRHMLTLLTALFVGLFFLVHPVHLNIAPVPPRRADMLALFFTIAVLLAARSNSAAWRRIAPPIFTLLAVGSKETGAIAPFLLFFSLLIVEPDTPGKRITRAFRASLPSFLMLLPFLAARQAVIGGLGGHMGVSGPMEDHGVTPFAAAAFAMRILREFQRATFYPYPIFAPLVPGPIVRWAILAILSLGSIQLLWGRRSGRLAMLAFFWMICGWSIHGFSGSISPWYTLHTVAPYSLLAGVLILESVVAFQGASVIRKGVASVLVLLLAGSFWLNGKGSPLFQFRSEWGDLTRLTEQFTADLSREIDNADPGETIVVYGLPFGVRPRPGSPIHIAAGMTTYTVKAWCELTRPGKKIRVSFPERDVPPPEPDEILVTVRVERGPR